ncbi:MAG: PqqD family peptide modification chaperone [Acidobacteriota bacterium]
MANSSEELPQGQSEVASGSAERDRARFAMLKELLRRRGDRYRDLSWCQAEEWAKYLAAKLLEDYGPEELAGFRWIGIPRGGIVVLGLLSYMLNLPASAFWPPSQKRGSKGSERRPWVLVDDVALTGYRLREAIDILGLRSDPSSSSPAGIFAHLASPAPLRQEVAAADGGWLRCVAARDLEVWNPLVEGEEQREGRGDRAAEIRLALSVERAGKTGRYWAGWPELISFPWSEPEMVFWNSSLGAAESGWRLSPPHRCLKHRAAFGPPRVSAAIHRRQASVRRWRMAEEVVWGEFDGLLYLAHPRLDEVHRLHGSALDFYRGLIHWGDEQEVILQLADEYGVDAEELRGDLTRLVGELVSRGLLEPVDEVPREETR